MKYISEYLKIILDQTLDAVICIDKNGIITLVNKKAEILLNIKEINYYNKDINEVINESELKRIIETGKKEINVKISFNNRDYIVDRIPVIKDEKIEGAIAIFHDMTSISKISEKDYEEAVYKEALDTINDTLNERVVVVNEKGFITMMSDSYKEFLEVDNPVGKHVTDVIENTRLHLVVESGKEEIGEIQVLNGHKAIAIRKPIKENGKVLGAVGKILFRDISELVSLSKKITNLEKELIYLKNELDRERIKKDPFNKITGSSDKIKEVKNLATKVSKTDTNVLINGESGTGKELFAHAIHNSSNRSHKPFIKINCAAIPSELLESELFGYEEGAFTGAKKGGKLGKFEVADKGTLLLDEIGDMPLTMQAKLLRVLQEKEFERIGSNIVKKVDVRIIASTNKDLLKLVEEDKFREDLYYRLNVMNINLPPLRNRKSDIIELTDELVSKMGNKLGIYVEGVSEKVINYFLEYNWPGNIRELENIIERAINLLGDKFIIDEKHLPLYITKNKTNKFIRTGKNLKRLIADLEKKTIKECLEETGYNKRQSAKILNISRVSLYKKIEKYNLN